MKKKLFEKKIDIVCLIVLVIFFGYCLIGVPMRELEDSFQYLTQLPSRDPVYALLLWIVKKCFGDYTVPLSILQNLLAIVCIYWTYNRLNLLMKFKTWQRPLILLALLAPHIITPLASLSHMVITCSVLTEGIGLSLYYVWALMILSLILGYYGNDWGKALVVSLLLSSMMSMIRGQFLICLAVWGIAMVYTSIKNGKWKKILLYLGIFVVCYICQTMAVKVYHYGMSGIFTSTVASKPMLLSNIIYVADESDADAIDDKRLKQAFLTMLSDSQDRRLTIDYAQGSIIDRALFHEAGHEEINFDCVTMELNELIYEIEQADESYFEQFLVYRDKYADMIIKSTFSQVLPRYIENFFVISSLGFVRSVAVEKGPLVYYAVLAYLLAIILTFILYIKNKNSRSALFMIFVLVTICGTVFGTSLMIECLSRYMIYNLPLFYIAALSLLNETITVFRKKRND